MALLAFADPVRATSIRRLLKMRLITTLYGLLLAGSVVPSVEAAQRPTIPQIIQSSKPGVPTWGNRIRELAPRPFEEAVATSDLIVVGSLRKLRTYLSADETELYTDFEVVPTSTIAGRTLPLSRKPGAQTIVLRQWGGRLVIDGVTVEIGDADFPFLPTNTPLLLFLSFDSEAQKYEIFDAIGGAFELQGGRRLKHLATTPLTTYRRFEGQDLDVAISEIRRLGR
jgi:hypothetical protein